MRSSNTKTCEHCLFCDICPEQGPCEDFSPAEDNEYLPARDEWIQDFYEYINEYSDGNADYGDYTPGVGLHETE